QLARVYLAVANDGVAHPVHLVREIQSPAGEVVLNMDESRSQRIAARPSTWQAVKEGLRHVLQWHRGTAYTAFAGAPYDPAGKPGSAQTATAAHGWFAGFAPAADPEIVVVVFAEHGESGARTAPIAREIMDGY